MYFHLPLLIGRIKIIEEKGTENDVKATHIKALPARCVLKREMSEVEWKRKRYRETCNQ